MAPWWAWVLLWVLLLAGSAVWLGLLSRRVWRKVTVLTREVERAAAAVAELEARAEELRDLDLPPTAVTQPPHRMWAQYREQRASARAARRARRAERMPPWARVD
ncbi:MAG TPA: hypothetical protein VFN34_12070 [Ornithinibacter sp.]|nr:hypothetical protein [Ornithinibacter sp.]